MAHQTGNTKIRFLCSGSAHDDAPLCISLCTHIYIYALQIYFRRNHRLRTEPSYSHLLTYVHQNKTNSTYHENVSCERKRCPRLDRYFVPTDFPDFRRTSAQSNHPRNGKIKINSGTGTPISPISGNPLSSLG
jgi:hypothetical protein